MTVRQGTRFVKFTSTGGCFIAYYIIFLILFFPTLAANPQELDIGFVVDSSDIVNWSQMLRFVTSILSSFDISEERAHVGLIVFGDTAAVSFGFNALQGASFTREGIEQLITRVPQLGGSQRRIDLAFDVAYKDMFSDSGGSRMTARKVDLQNVFLCHF